MQDDKSKWVAIPLRLGWAIGRSQELLRTWPKDPTFHVNAH
jgi:hypothetical protein